MSEKTKPCPQCGGVMHFRLGEFQCAACDYHETAAQPKTEERPAAGNQRRESWQAAIGSTLPGGKQYSGQPLPPSSPPTSSNQPAPIAGSYTDPPQPPAPGALFGGSSWERIPASAAPLRDMHSTLEMEKRVYFVIYVSMQALTLIVVAIMFAMTRGLLQVSGAGMPTTPGVPSLAQLNAAMPMLLGIYIVSLLIAVGVVWWALFGSETWVKWCCMGCVGIGLVSSLFNIGQSLTGMAAFSQLGVPITGALQALFLTTFILSLAWQVWFVSILYRDVQQRQYG